MVSHGIEEEKVLPTNQLFKCQLTKQLTEQEPKQISDLSISLLPPNIGQVLKK